MDMAQVDMGSTGGTFVDRDASELDDALNPSRDSRKRRRQAPGRDAQAAPRRTGTTDADRRVIWPIHWLPSDLAARGVCPRVRALFVRSHAASLKRV